MYCARKGDNKRQSITLNHDTKILLSNKTNWNSHSESCNFVWEFYTALGCLWCDVTICKYPRKDNKINILRSRIDLGLMDFAIPSRIILLNSTKPQPRVGFDSDDGFIKSKKISQESTLSLKSLSSSHENTEELKIVIFYKLITFFFCAKGIS